MSTPRERKESSWTILTRLFLPPMHLISRWWDQCLHSGASDTQTTINKVQTAVVFCLLKIPCQYKNVEGTAFARDWNKKPGTVLWKIPFPSAASDFFSQSQNQLLVQTLWRHLLFVVLHSLQCLYRSHVPSHASTSVRTLKILNTGTYTTDMTHKNTAHTGRNG